VCVCPCALLPLCVCVICVCSMFPKATADTFSTKLYQELLRHPRFEKPKFSQRAFTIDHYAGKVRALD